MKWTRLLMLIICAALAFGGSFTCTTGDNNDIPTTNQ
jgi:hypothetical protein